MVAEKNKHTHTDTPSQDAVQHTLTRVFTDRSAHANTIQAPPSSRQIRQEQELPNYRVPLKPGSKEHCGMEAEGRTGGGGVWGGRGGR